MQYSASEFETLYTQCFPSAMRLAMGLLHDEDEARDVVHEVFLRLWEAKTRADNPAAFIIRSVRNASLDRIKRLDTRERAIKKISLEPPSDDLDPETLNEEVASAIRNLLTQRERQVVSKIYTEGLSYKNAAASLGISVAAINKNLVVALKKLRNHFKTERT